MSPISINVILTPSKWNRAMMHHYYLFFEKCILEWYRPIRYSMKRVNKFVIHVMHGYYTRVTVDTRSRYTIIWAIYVFLYVKHTQLSVWCEAIAIRLALGSNNISCYSSFIIDNQSFTELPRITVAILWLAVCLKTNKNMLNIRQIYLP